MDPPGPSNNQKPSDATSKLNQQVDDVVGIMQENFTRVMDRDAKLSELDERADKLQAGAAQFQTNAGDLKRKHWWENMKMWLILGGIGIIIVIIIILSIVL